MRRQGELSLAPCLDIPYYRAWISRQQQRCCRRRRRCCRVRSPRIGWSSRTYTHKTDHTTTNAFQIPPHRWKLIPCRSPADPSSFPTISKASGAQLAHLGEVGDVSFLPTSPHFGPSSRPPPQNPATALFDDDQKLPNFMATIFSGDCDHVRLVY